MHDLETDSTGVKQYKKEWRTLLTPPLCRPLVYEDAMFDELVKAVEKLPVKERSENVWVQLCTWLPVDRREVMRKAGTLTQRKLRPLAWAIRTSLKLDHQERTRKVG